MIIGITIGVNQPGRGAASPAEPGGWTPVAVGDVTADDPPHTFSRNGGAVNWAQGAHSDVAYAGDVAIRCLYNADSESYFGFDTIARSADFYGIEFHFNLQNRAADGGGGGGTAGPGGQVGGVSVFEIRRTGDTMDWLFAPDGVTFAVVRTRPGITTDPLYISTGAIMNTEVWGPVTRVTP